MANEKRRVLLGEIGPAHGIRGEVLIRSYAGAPEDIAAYGALEDETGARSFELNVVRVSGKGVVARIADIGDRTAAEKLRGTKLYVSRDRLPEAADGEYYHSDLIGLEAVSPEGEALGHVVAVQNFGAGDLLEIRLAGRKTTEFIPFEAAFVPHVDIPAGRVTAILPVVVEGEQSGEPEPDGADVEEGS